MKSNNKVLVIFAVLLLNVLVLYMVGQNLMGTTSEYDDALAQARTYAEQELCSKSIEKYEEALALEETLAVRLEMIPVYEKGLLIGEFSNAYEVKKIVEKIVEDYRDQPSAYESACEYYLRYGNYEECAQTLMQARDLKITSKKLDDMRETVRYQYKKSYSMYDSVLPCFDGYFTASTNGTYAHLNALGSYYSDGDYTYLSSMSEGYAFAKAIYPDGSEKSFIINEAEQRQVYLEGVTTSSGVGAATNQNGETVLLLSGKVGKTYKYFTVDGKEAFGEYTFAGRFRNNVAAVKVSKNEWHLITGTGNQLVDKTFTDVVLNEFDECAPKGLILANDGSGYRLYNYLGEQIGDATYDGAKAFVDGYAAFKKGDKWGFIDTEGKVVIKAQYDDAKSFSNGLGAVKIGEEWYFIDANNEVVIEAGFEDINYLNDNGICFVKLDGYWSSLGFYYTGA